MGLTEFSSVTFAAASYVAGYVRKKVRQADDPEHYTRVDPETGELVSLHCEFARMSRRPAIGLTWLKRYWADVYPRDYVVIDGVRSKPPRAYDKFFEDPRHDFPGITYRERLELLYHVKLDRWDPDYDDSPETLAARHRNHQARVNLFQGRDAV